MCGSLLLRLTRELAAKNRSLQQYQTGVAQIRSSFTYRIGRIITWLPRMLRKILRKTHCTPVET